MLVWVSVGVTDNFEAPDPEFVTLENIFDMLGVLLPWRNTDQRAAFTPLNISADVKYHSFDSLL